mgnify:CR=1 FL=1
MPQTRVTNLGHVEATETKKTRGNGMTFSMRESQILDHLQDGQTNKQIGANLGISPNTVRDHIRRMMLRTGVCTRVSLAALWLRQIQVVARTPLQAAPERRSGDRRVVPTTAAPPTNVVIHM